MGQIPSPFCNSETTGYFPTQRKTTLKDKLIWGGGTLETRAFFHNTFFYEFFRMLHIQIKKNLSPSFNFVMVHIIKIWFYLVMLNFGKLMCKGLFSTFFP